MNLSSSLPNKDVTFELPYMVCLFIYLFGVLRRFQHCTDHIMTGSWKGRGNQYVQLVKVLYCKLPTNGKQLPAFPLEVGPGTEPRPQRWEARVLPLCHCGPHIWYGHIGGIPFMCRVRNLKFATYLKFATCENTNKMNELW